MRVWCGSLLLGLLIFLLLHQSCVEGQLGRGIGQCCFSYYQKQIPARRIADYEETEVVCPKPGLIFIVKNKDGKNVRVCVNPNQGWVQRVRGEIDRKPVDNSTDPTE